MRWTFSQKNVPIFSRRATAMILVPLESLKSEDDVTWSKHCSRPHTKFSRGHWSRVVLWDKVGVKTNSKESRRFRTPNQVTTARQHRHVEAVWGYECDFWAPHGLRSTSEDHAVTLSCRALLTWPVNHEAWCENIHRLMCLSWRMNNVYAPPDGSKQRHTLIFFDPLFRLCSL